MKISRKFLSLILIVLIVSCSTFFAYAAGQNETDRIPINPITTTTTKPTTTETTTKKPTEKPTSTTTTKPTTKPTAKPTTTKPSTSAATTKPQCSHSWGSAVVSKAATTSSNGTLTYTCKKCKAKKTSTINKIGSIKLSTSTYTYNGKAKSPSVVIKDSKGKNVSKSYYSVSVPKGRKNVGKYTYKITFKGRYSGKKNLTLTIKPVTTTASVKNYKTKFTVKWKKKTTQVKGYQVQYATNSSFKNAKTNTINKNSTTSKTIKKSNSKITYYVRVRTYKTVNGEKICSSWSKTIKVKSL